MLKQGFKRPVVQAFVPVASPVFILADVLRMADSYRANITGSALLHNVFRHCV